MTNDASSENELSPGLFFTLPHPPIYIYYSAPTEPNIVPHDEYFYNIDASWVNELSTGLFFTLPHPPIYILYSASTQPNIVLHDE
jgi:hypothetical protein